ncbi:hypothetical protein BFINE_16860 [Bacteroides finegoldii DSM 17565]|nr:hypothetical protein BFINE_16860 [Bacteroides finegoldii DSM 17565]
MNAITLEEVETMSVLKDGAATALYGARGANGVILLTTKRGAYNSFDVDINYKHGFTLPSTSRRWRMPILMPGQ